MKYRYTQKENDLFYVCSLIEYINRNSNLSKKEIIELFKDKGLKKLFYLADVYHCENIEKVLEELSLKYHFEIVKKEKKESDPTFYDMGKVYFKLIKYKSKKHHQSYFDSFKTIYKSPFTRYLDNYNANMMLSNIPYLYYSYLNKKPLEY